MSHLAFPLRQPVVPRTSQLRLALGALVALLVVLTVAGASLFLLHQRAETLRDAELRADSAARLLEEHVHRTFRSTEFIIDQVVDYARSRPLSELARSRDAFDDLLRLKNGLPEPGTLWIAGADGTVLQGSLDFPPNPANVSDRHYFNAHLNKVRGLVIGPLVNTKLRKLQAFHLSKRIDDANGRFIGVAVAGTDAQYYTDFYHSLGLGPNSSVTLVDLDGRVILRQPDWEQWVGASVAEGPVFKRLIDSPRGILRAVSPLDGVERLVAYRRIAPYNVAVMCSVSVDDALAGWWEAVLVTGVILALVGLAVGILSWVAVRSLAREEALVTGLEEEVRERTAEALIREEEVRHANETKTRFLAAASHDLRQPLQAAGMFVEALAGRMGENPHSHIVDKLRQSIDATQALLTTLLDASTLEAGRVEPNQTIFPLAPMLANLVDLAEPEASEKNLKLRVVPTDIWVHSDPVLLERLMRNLLVNALRYTQSGGVLLGCRRRGGRVAIEVVDTGPGIPPDKQSVIFDDFTRLGDRGSGPSRGLGLGLGVVRRMAALLGHQIELRSRPGHGSAFAIIIDMADSQSRRVSNGVEPGNASSLVSAENAQPSTSP